MKKCLLSLLTSFGLLASTRAASTWNYTGAEAGLWSTAANWTLSGGATHVVPVIGDDAVLGGALTVSNVTFNQTYTGAGLNALTLDSPGHASITLNQSAGGTVMIAANEYIGTTVSGNNYNQSAGTNIAGNLYLGFGNGGFGTYLLSGSGTLNGTTEFIGFAGTGGGSFTQSGGTHNVSSALTIGHTSTNAGNAYTLSGGTLAFGNGAGLYVGNAGKGSFTQSAGAVNFSGAASVLSVGTAASSTGNLYTLSGTGAITGVAKLSVGVAGSGTFTQTGGTLSLGSAGNYAGSLYVGDGAGSTGVYNLSATTGTGSLAVDNLTIGNAGNGTFVQNGGTATVTNTFNLSSNTSATGNYTLNSGALNIAASGTATIGILGNGFFTQTGGTFTSPQVTIATGVSNNLANGTYTLSGGTATTGGMLLGFNAGAVGTVNQTGGTINVTAAGTDIVTLGTNASSTGNYTMDTTAGASALNATYLRVGDSGAGTFTQNAGTVTLTQGASIGRSTGSTGTYNLNGGNLVAGTIPTPAVFTVGGAGTGTMNQSGGTFTLNGAGAALSLGTVGGSGTYNASGGSLSTGTILSGNGGTGHFIQTGGTVAASQLLVSQVAGSNGTYALSGPAGVALNVSSFEAIGVATTGTFTQSGGTHTLSGDIQLGQTAAGTGIYNLNGGVFNIGANIGMGHAGFGFLQQTAGALTVGLGCYIGSLTGSTGNYSLSGGTASMGTAYVGYSGTGAVNQNGGALTAGSLYIGTLFLNGTATGTYNHTAGSLTATSAFYLGIGGADGNYTLGGLGTLNVPNAPVSFVGSNGTFTQYGGTVNGYLTNGGQFVFQGGTYNGTLDNGANGTASFTNFVYFGSGLKNHGTLNIAAGGQVGTAAGQTFSNDGTVELSAAGQIYSNGPVVNNGLITGTGSLGGSSTFTNNLSITQGAGPLTFNFAPGNAINNGTITLAAGRALNLYGGITNAGSFDLNGASVLQNGTLANASNGTLSGPGTILANFTNSGVVTPGSGTLNIANAWINTGIVQLSGIPSHLNGGTITNNGTIEGMGNAGAAINNTTGVIEAIGGTLVIGGTLTNSGSGTLAAATGSKLLVTGGLTNNAGFISLSGGTFDNNNRALTNAGQISGYGTLRTGGAGLTNAGSITFTGGNTTVNGNVTNNAGQSIHVAYNPATFTGSVVNNGTFKTTSTTTTFAGTFTNNGAFISDPADNFFNDLTIGPAGILTGGHGDRFFIAGNLISYSAQNQAWDTAAAELSFSGFGDAQHVFSVTGEDLGRSDDGFVHNFSWDTVRLAAGDYITLTDVGTTGGALYTQVFDLGGGLAQLSAITGNGLNIYYNPRRSENAWLGNGTYALGGGGFLTPVPEPGAIALLALAGLTAMRRRRV